MMVVAMIENPAGAAIVERIAAVPGIDVVFVASTDLGSFSGLRQGDPKSNEAIVTGVVEATTKQGLKLGGPLAWRNRSGYTFFQGPGETALIRCGTRVSLGLQPTGCPASGVAAIEGRER